MFLSARSWIRYASSTSNQIVGYSRCGDSALWTGAYLAAESFRYKVTQSPDALKNVRSALAALKGLADVTGDDRLARWAWSSRLALCRGHRQRRGTKCHHPDAAVDLGGSYVAGPGGWSFFWSWGGFRHGGRPRVKSGVSDLVTRLISYISRVTTGPRATTSPPRFRRGREELADADPGRPPREPNEPGFRAVFHAADEFQRSSSDVQSRESDFNVRTWII